MKTLFVIAALSAASLCNAGSFVTQARDAWPPLSGINSVAFPDAKFDQKFAGNGFLFEYRGKTYAATAKHVLLIAKSEDMKTVSTEGKVKTWRIHPNHDDAGYVELGRLINANAKEAIDPKVLETDWLVFEVKSNQSKLQTLKLSDKALAKGDKVFIVGCTYKTEEACKQNVYDGVYVDKAKSNLLLDLPGTDPATLGGLSGAPVMDKDGAVVGLVSNALPNPKGDGLMFAPASLEYLKSVLATIH